MINSAGFFLHAGSAYAACGRPISVSRWASGNPLTCDSIEVTYVSNTANRGSANVVVSYLSESSLFNIQSAGPPTLDFAQLAYDVTIDLGRFFEEVSLTSNINPFFAYSVLDATFEGGMADIIIQNLSGSTSVSSPLTGSPSSLTVNSVYTSIGGLNSSITFGFRQGTTPVNVPAPLPILGLGVALGFSRKLRNRIRTRYQD